MIINYRGVKKIEVQKTIDTNLTSSVIIFAILISSRPTKSVIVEKASRPHILILNGSCGVARNANKILN